MTGINTWVGTIGRTDTPGNVGVAVGVAEVVLGDALGDGEATSFPVGVATGVDDAGDGEFTAFGVAVVAGSDEGTGAAAAARAASDL